MSSCSLPGDGPAHGHGACSPRETASLALAALGIVYGDIGTSPLYTVKECFHGMHAVAVTPGNVLGVLSLIFWSLTMVVSFKYVVFILRADNKGEGGIFALLAMLRSGPASKGRHWPHMMLMAAFGAALLYGDGVITPAISVLSAIEGLEVATAAAKDFVAPLTCVVLVGLFMFQKHGTASIGRVFGPVMILWFAVIGGLGAVEIAGHPGILAALNPLYAWDFFAVNHLHGIVVLGSVVLCITGGEALYADMGHFGRNPIRISWYAVVLPGLLLNYFGQGALLLDDPEKAFNPFYGLVPEALLYPMVALSTAATIIASQALISGVYSLTQQAIQLGFTPRMRIVHTSERAAGQIYMPTVNWLLMLACLGLVLAFQESSRLAAAYGIAVTATMAITSILYFEVARLNWKWPTGRAACLLVVFLAFDLAFLGANLLKFVDGGWFTLSLALGVLAVMVTWRDGRSFLARHYGRMRVPVDVFLRDVAAHPPVRTPGTAVFMSISPEGVPHTLLHHLKHEEALHERVVLLSILAAETPRVDDAHRVEAQALGQGFYRLTARYGFMETPNVTDILELAGEKDLYLDVYATSFYLGRETLLTSGDSGMANWRKTLFAFLSRNAWNATSFFGIPPGRVVELGNQVEI
ncbi:Low affinity potassium transport system protein kup [Fundidesulfovibrio magnetotacticus]|uniref:Probable potassium transport system protein Kup n=1 Tax=Fundidesulfovibrio magnetotacticus TaxID=2730080 RepID=A0A6V8LT82_9BACT|nr:potassium transporter Kup [Fundidesulfovibrio magnetotacticus]GFK92847.1 Low affinity potassium transport system protein kup [Fundidesulfovibrio magnetotacticus]